MKESKVRVRRPGRGTGFGGWGNLETGQKCWYRKIALDGRCAGKGTVSVRVRKGLHWIQRRDQWGFLWRAWGAPSVRGLERPAQQRREEAGGGAVSAGSRPSQAQAKRTGAPTGLCRRAGEQGDGRDRLRPLKTSPEPPQGAPEIFVAGRHLLQQAGDVEGTGTHAGCAAACGSNRIWRSGLPSPQPRPLPIGHAPSLSYTPPVRRRTGVKGLAPSPGELCSAWAYTLQRLPTERALTTPSPGYALKTP